jgi:hypothetical protein
MFINLCKPLQAKTETAFSSIPTSPLQPFVSQLPVQYRPQFEMQRESDPRGGHYV